MPEIAFQYQVPQKEIGTYAVDAFVAEHYQFSNSVTDIPVEDGSNISDHIIEDQDVISVEAFVGNAAFEVVTKDGNSVSNLQAPDRMARIRQAYHELKSMAKGKKLVDVVLGLETFTNMAITSFSIDREAETGANLPFTMEFRKLKIAQSDKTKINASGKETGDQTSSTANAGKAGTEDPNLEQAKEEWRFQIRKGGPATPAKYLQEFGVPYPQ